MSRFMQKIRKQLAEIGDRSNPVMWCHRCREGWDFEDYQCPCCGRGATEAPGEAHELLTLTYVIDNDEYDVIRIDTGKSVFDEKDNYTNEE